MTGNAGSGKTALLGLLAALSDPDQAPAVPRDGLPAGFTISGSAIAEAIYAGTMTTGQVRDRIAAAAGLRAETTQELIDGLSRRATGPLVVLIDALDEAADPGGLISGLLSPLMSECAGTLRLLLGTRPHLLTAKLLGTPESGRYLLGRPGLRAVRRPGQHPQPTSGGSCSPRTPWTAPTGHPACTGPRQQTSWTPSPRRSARRPEHRSWWRGSPRPPRRPRPSCPTPTDPAWRAALPQRAGQAMRRDLRLRLGERSGQGGQAAAAPGVRPRQRAAVGGHLASPGRGAVARLRVRQRRPDLAAPGRRLLRRRGPRRRPLGVPAVPPGPHRAPPARAATSTPTSRPSPMP